VISLDGIFFIVGLLKRPLFAGSVYGHTLPYAFIEVDLASKRYLVFGFTFIDQIFAFKRFKVL
jgi:hypothetical protein